MPKAESTLDSSKEVSKIIKLEGSTYNHSLVPRKKKLVENINDCFIKLELPITTTTRHIELF